MRTSLAVRILGCLMLAGGFWTAAYPACAVPTPVGHLLDSYFLCPDLGQVTAYLYQQSDPGNTNSDSVDAFCEATDPLVYCPYIGAGIAGDGKVNVETDWYLPAMNGCPIIGGPHRLIIATASGARTGSALIVSLGGTDDSVGYTIEAAHPYDGSSGTISPLSCATTAAVAGFDGSLLSLRFSLPPVHTDCDPGSLGDYLKSVHSVGPCLDSFQPQPAFGSVYALAQPCAAPVDFRIASWTNTGTTPDAAGRASVPYTLPPADECRYFGTTTMIGGVETPLVTGFVDVRVDCNDDDGDGFSECAGDCNDADPAIHPGAQEICNGLDDNCNGLIDEGACEETVVDIFISLTSALGKGSGTVTWSTTAEAGVVGFNVVSYDQKGTRTQLNPILIPCEECITGVGHTYTSFVPKHKSGHNIFIEMLRANGTVSVFGPAQRM